MYRAYGTPLLAGILLLAGGREVGAQAVGGRPAASQPSAAELLEQVKLLQQQLQQQQEQLKALQEQINQLKNATQPAGGPAPVAPPASQPTGDEELENLITAAGGSVQPSASQPAAAAGPLTLKGAVQSFNPDISLNADFLGSFSTHRGEFAKNDFLFRELEVGFSGAVDPYTSANMIVTVGRDRTIDDYAVDLEEAYLTYLGLGHDLQARFGQYRADFGRANSIHLHALPWTDYPLVIQRYFGKEGMEGVGTELSWLVPNPWNQYIALEYEVFNNDNSTLFAGDKSRDFTNLFRLKSFSDLSPNSTLEYGTSFATAPNDGGHGEHRSMIEGLDMTYRWKPKGEGLYKSFLLQNELYFSQADIVGGQEKTWGMYSAAEYQFAREWKIGARYDFTQLPWSSSLHEHGYSAYLTFLQSEFVFWRLGYLVTDHNFREDSDRGDQQLFLQLNWTLGVHPAHRY